MVACFNYLLKSGESNTVINNKPIINNTCLELLKTLEKDGGIELWVQMLSASSKPPTGLVSPTKGLNFPRSMASIVTVI